MANIVLSEKVSPTSFMSRIRKSIPKNSKKKPAVTDKNFTIPSIDEYNRLVDMNYKVMQLKTICKHYKQKLSGNKDELNSRIYNFLRLSSKCYILQKTWRRYILKIYNTARGPARLKRDICINETDFYTMDSTKNIEYIQFISYKDEKENQIYGFDILSLFNLLAKGTKKTNPYNRNKIPKNIITNINLILRCGKIFGDNITTKIEEPEKISPEKKLELRTLSLFQDIDELGSYTNHNWFNQLGRTALVQYIRELADIWTYRANLTSEVKRQICPPVGDPFRTVNLNLLPNVNLLNLKNLCLTIMEYMVKRGINEASRGLGANYVLCALTLVNNAAAESLPWLYQSVVYNE